MQSLGQHQQLAHLGGSQRVNGSPSLSSNAGIWALPSSKLLASATAVSAATSSSSHSAETAAGRWGNCRDGLRKRVDTAQACAAPASKPKQQSADARSQQQPTSAGLSLDAVQTSVQGGASASLLQVPRTLVVVRLVYICLRDNGPCLHHGLLYLVKRLLLQEGMGQQLLSRSDSPCGRC